MSRGRDAAPAVTGGPALACRGLAVGYDHRAVVEGLDLALEPGRALALVGTNGSGKSTLLRTIIGLLPPVVGSCTALGGPPGRAPARTAYLAQSHPGASVLPLRVVDVVRMARYASLGLFGRTTAKDRALVDDAMDQLGITHLAQQPLRALSGGQRQRVFLAQAAARDADLLVLDEPTAGLDVTGTGAYRAMVDAALARGAAVVTATHDIADAQRHDDVLLLAGRVVAQGPPEVVLTAEHLLQAFGIALQAVDHHSHLDLIATEHPHAHPEGDGHTH